MQVLEKILQEIDELIVHSAWPNMNLIEKEKVTKIIRSHMEDDRWIPVEERLPENSKHKGAFCPKYRVLTKYGETVGWYNPDFKSWYVLLWFMTDNFLESEIDLDRGDVPRVVKVPLLVKGIVLAWQPLPAPYQPKEGDYDKA